MNIDPINSGLFLPPDVILSVAIEYHVINIAHDFTWPASLATIVIHHCLFELKTTFFTFAQRGFS